MNQPGISPWNAILLNDVTSIANREIGVPGVQLMRGILKLLLLERNEGLLLGRLSCLLVEVDEGGVVFADVLHNFPVRL